MDKDWVIKNLSMLLVRLVRAETEIQREEIANKAMEFLHNQGLFGSAIREQHDELAD